MDLYLDTSGRGAFCTRRRYVVKRIGAYRKANVGMSNDKICEKHIRRKTKGSHSTLIGVGLVGY